MEEFDTQAVAMSISLEVSISNLRCFLSSLLEQKWGSAEKAFKTPNVQAASGSVVQTEAGTRRQLYGHSRSSRDPDAAAARTTLPSRLILISLASSMWIAPAGAVYVC